MSRTKNQNKIRSIHDDLVRDGFFLYSYEVRSGWGDSMTAVYEYVSHCGKRKATMSYNDYAVGWDRLIEVQVTKRRISIADAPDFIRIR